MDAKCNECLKNQHLKCENYEPRMDAKEAIKLLKGEPVFLNDFPEVKRRQAARLAISALEKVPALEAENERLEKYNDTLIADNNLLMNELDTCVKGIVEG